MDALIESLCGQHAAMPVESRDALGLAAPRAAALAELQRAGIPGSRSERWKYTPLRSLARRRFARAEPVVADAGVRSAVAAIPAPRLVFVNGHVDLTLSALDELPAGVQLLPLSTALRGEDSRAVNVLARRFERDDELFARANAALAEDGALLRIEAGVELKPVLHLVFVGQPAAADVASHLRCLIELREVASARVVEHWIGGEGTRQLTTAVCHVHLKPEARLRHVRLQQCAAGTALFARTEAVLASAARYERLDLELGHGLSRHELNIGLQGAGASVQADGVLLAAGSAHVDTRLGIDHVSGGTSCSLTWRGLGRDQGRVAFHGGIQIRAGADGSDAMLSNKNLLLSEGAEIDTQPVLEIHADEVKAAHGATVGQLDRTALFYLRSRGLPLEQAASMLTAAFCHELLQSEPDAVLHGWLATRLDAALQTEATP